MDIIFQIILGICIVCIIIVSIVIIVLMPSGSYNQAYLECPDFWVKRDTLPGSGNQQVCHINTSDSSNWGNPNQRIPVTYNGVSVLDYWDDGYTTSVGSVAEADVTSGDIPHLTVSDINASHNCAKYKWTQVNDIKWNGISNNFTLRDGCVVTN